MTLFGTKVREARRAKGISLRAFAETIGISFTYLSKIEAGEMQPPAEAKIRLIVEHLSLDADELFSLANKVPGDLAAISLQRHVPQILRILGDLSNEERLKLIEDLKKDK
jgi:HTH-type transcriptional regulator, competence development regulator